LDEVIVLNSTEEKSRLVPFGAGAQRYCGTNASAWLQKRWRTVGGSLSAIVSAIDNERPPQAAAWGEFLATYKKENAECQVEIGLTQIPKFSELNEQNFLAVKALLDLMEAGVRLVHVTSQPSAPWRMVFGAGSKEMVAIGAVEVGMSLTARLDDEAIIYQTEGAISQRVLDDLRSVLAKGTPITVSDLKAPKQEEYKVVDIEDGDPGRSYQNVFGIYLANAQSIRIVDPYVRQEFQVRNVEDLLASARTPKGCRVELVTTYERNDRYGLSEETRSRERLDALKTRLERKGFLFTYRFDPEIHDRMIETENWQIVLGRGLDFYYPPEPGQAARRARRCRIIYIPKTKAS
jgi:hypothetical protein